MTDLDTTTLDTLVERLERAAEQLRTGDLSPDAAAGLVEDCAAMASQASAELERMAIVQTLERTRWNKRAAAHSLSEWVADIYEE